MEQRKADSRPSFSPHTMSRLLQVCAGPALKMFRSDELELLICGLPDLNFEDLQAVARYEGGYNQEHPTIKCLWQCLHTFSLEQKKLFLKFTTGCDR